MYHYLLFIILKRKIGTYTLSINIKKIFSILIFLPSAIVYADQALDQLVMFNRNMPGVSHSAGNQDKVSPILKNKSRNRPRVNKTSKVLNKPVVHQEDGTSDKEAINKSAFTQVKDRMFPLSHEQVLQLHQEYNSSQFALNSTAGTPPRPAVTTQVVRLDPGSTPSVIRLGQGFISSVVFLDSTGAPWPIIAYDLGDPTSFNIQWDKSGNTLMIQSKKLYTYGNMAIRLQGLSTPVMLTLIPGQKAIDYRVDMRVVGYGPNANKPTEINLPPATNSVLMQVLDDVAPPGSKLMMVKGGPAKAWTIGDIMYVRTRLTVLSPGWMSMMSSADGTHVYKMSDSPILLVSWHGKVMQLKIEGL